MIIAGEVGRSLPKAADPPGFYGHIWFNLFSKVCVLTVVQIESFDVLGVILTPKEICIVL